MRRFLTGIVIAAIVAIIPAMALAGNKRLPNRSPTDCEKAAK